jgi:uracil-DNA glycosylase
VSSYHAQAYYLGDRRKTTLCETIKVWKEFFPRAYLPLPHPSPRNQPWLCRNPWFEEQFVLEVQNIIRTMNL